MHAWLIWLIIAAVLAGAEALSLDLVLIMLAGGALGGAVAAIGLDAPFQVLVAIVVSVALLGGVRPVAKRHLEAHATTRTGSAALVGREAVVLRPVDAHGGLVKLNGGEWSARSFDPTRVLKVGDTVQVMEIAGATAVVWDGP